MQTKRLPLIALAMALLAASAFAQVPLYGNRPGTDAILPLPLTSRAAPDPTLALWTNPAGLGNAGDGHIGSIAWFATTTDNPENWFGPVGSDYGAGFNLGTLGFGWEARRGGTAANRYTWGMALPMAPGVSLGWAYHWSAGLNRQNSYDFGALVRPTHWLSIGGQVVNAFGARSGGTDTDPAWHLATAVRPLGPRLTLAVDATLWKAPGNAYGDNMDPTFTVDWEAMPGVSLRGGYAVDRELAFAGLSVTSGLWGVDAEVNAPTNTPAGAPENLALTTFRSSTHWTPSIFDGMRDKRIIHMRLRGEIVEEPTPRSLFVPQRRTLFETVKRIEQLRMDDRVAGLALVLDNPSAGLSDYVELRRALERFRESGRALVIYAKDYNFGAYYLASAADELLLYPAGEVRVQGFSLKMPYMRDLLEKLHITPQFLTMGEYKSAGEILTRNEMSDEAEEANDALLDAIWETVVVDIAKGRNVPPDTVESWINGAAYSGRDAERLGLVDALVYPDEFKQRLERTMGPNATPMAEMEHFMQPMRNPRWENLGTPKIAIVYAVGTIETGESDRPFFGDDVMGSRTVARAIEQARSDRRVKAILLRVDSPGGSALASDIIAREVRRTSEGIGDARQVPVIVSMSDVAASGGMYIAAHADTIYALPTSVTGSIGVVYGKLAYDTALDSIGVHLDGLQRGRNADMMGAEPWNEEQKKIVLRNMEDTYEDFLNVVAAGRGLSMDKVRTIARGRVWSGRHAYDLGLVDHHGGLMDAFMSAMHAGNIGPEERVLVDIYPAVPGGFHPTYGLGMALMGGPDSPFARLAEMLETVKKVENAEAEVRMQATVKPEDMTLR